jgi:hypothetical protein
VRIGSYLVFDPPTKELHHGEEGKEKESEEEEVIPGFSVRRTIECDACVWRLETSSRLFLV